MRGAVGALHVLPGNSAHMKELKMDIKKLVAHWAAEVEAAEKAVSDVENRRAAAQAEALNLEHQIQELSGRLAEVRRTQALELSPEAAVARWETATLNLEAVQRTLALLGEAAWPEPAVTAPVAPEPAVTTPVTTPVAPTADIDAEAVLEGQMTYPVMVMAVLQRNPASTKQWTLSELWHAAAKVTGQAATPTLRKRLETAVNRLVARGEVVAKFSVARGARVYSLH